MTSTNNRTINGYETIDGELVLSGENLNMIVLDYKEEQYKKIISNSKRHRKSSLKNILHVSLISISSRSRREPEDLRSSQLSSVNGAVTTSILFIISITLLQLQITNYFIIFINHYCASDITIIT